MVFSRLLPVTPRSICSKARALAAAQLAYNATVRRDAALATALLNVLGTSGELDAVPGFASARAEAKTLAPVDWTPQFKLALRLVDLHMKGGSN